MAANAYVAMLRGINVGGKNKLPMADLRAMFENAGCSDARTYIQSGNVLFRAESDVAAALPDSIPAAIQSQFGFASPVVLRSSDDMRTISISNPFLGIGDTTPLHVAFLRDEPDQEKVESLDAQRSPGDSFRVVGREIYLHCPNGLARTKLTNDYFDTKLGTVSTMRNWRTVRTLLEMAEE